MEKILNHINGNAFPAESGEWLSCFEPAKGKVYAHIADSDKTDVEKAVKAAESAFPTWSALAVSARSVHMMKLAELMERDLDKLAAAESKDNGKPLKLATIVDIPRAISNIRSVSYTHLTLPTTPYV